jgi:hypothetical protein
MSEPGMVTAEERFLIEGILGEEETRPEAIDRHGKRAWNAVLLQSMCPRPQPCAWGFRREGPIDCSTVRQERPRLVGGAEFLQDLARLVTKHKVDEFTVTRALCFRFLAPHASWLSLIALDLPLATSLTAFADCTTVNHGAECLVEWGWLRTSAWIGLRVEWWVHITRSLHGSVLRSILAWIRQGKQRLCVCE